MREKFNKLLENWSFIYWIGVVAGWISMFIALEIIFKFL